MNNELRRLTIMQIQQSMDKLSEINWLKINENDINKRKRNL